MLHIINFAHGALLTAAMYAAFFVQQLLGLDPYRRGTRPDAGVLRARLCAAALRHRAGRARRGPQHPAGHARARGRHRERAALRLPRRHAHHQPALRASASIELGPAFLARAARRSASSSCSWSRSALWLLLRCTDIGKAIRAVAKEKHGAELSGIDVAHIYAVTFGLGTACLAVAACLLIPTYYVNPHVGNAFVLVAFTIVVLGGMGSVPGALIGGLLVGVVESLSGLYLGESLGQIGIFVIFILVLLFRPTGCSESAHEGLRDRSLLVVAAARRGAAVHRRPTSCSISWSSRC